MASLKCDRRLALRSGAEEADWGLTCADQTNDFIHKVTDKKPFLLVMMIFSNLNQ
jgi:hypothetical protein